MASQYEEEDLYDELDATPILTGTEIAELSPDEMVNYDSRNENVIHHNTKALTTSLGFCEQIVIAAYKVVEYVPDLSNDKHSKFWKEDVSVITRAEKNLSPIKVHLVIFISHLQVIPNLVKSLTQDVRARSIIIKSFAAIRDLSIIIQKAGEIVKQTKGINALYRTLRS